MRKERLILSGLAISGLGLAAACGRTPDAADSLLVQCQAKNQETVSKDLELSNGQRFNAGDRLVEVLAHGRIRITTKSIDLQDGSAILAGDGLGFGSLFYNKDLALGVKSAQDKTILTLTLNCLSPQK